MKSVLHVSFFCKSKKGKVNSYTRSDYERDVQLLIDLLAFVTGLVEDADALLVCQQS
jgi:hypothetical protein